MGGLGWRTVAVEHVYGPLPLPLASMQRSVPAQSPQPRLNHWMYCRFPALYRRMRNRLFT